MKRRRLLVTVGVALPLVVAGLVMELVPAYYWDWWAGTARDALYIMAALWLGLYFCDYVREEILAAYQRRKGPSPPDEDAADLAELRAACAVVASDWAYADRIGVDVLPQREVEAESHP